MFCLTQYLNTIKTVWIKYLKNPCQYIYDPPMTREGASVVQNGRQVSFF